MSNLEARCVSMGSSMAIEQPCWHFHQQQASKWGHYGHVFGMALHLLDPKTLHKDPASQTGTLGLPVEHVK